MMLNKWLFFIMTNLKNKSKRLKSKTAIHFYLWMVFALAMFVPIQIYQSADLAFRIALGIILPLLLAVYIHFLILEKYFQKGQFLFYGLNLALLLILSGIAAQLIIDFLVPEVEGGIKSFLNPVFLIIVTSGFRYYSQGLKLQAQLQEAQAKQYKAELDLLKFQVNPHFFFNTLNNLFAMARKQKDQSTAKGIAKLSHLMRYIIYDCNVDKIDLQKEVEQIKHFLALQKLRFSKEDKINISFELAGDFENKTITPMLLLPFVENAFKHGISLANESAIKINLNVEKSRLLFSVSNSINKKRKAKTPNESGIGLANVKKRLELLYPDVYDLRIDNSGDVFNITLRMEL